MRSPPEARAVRARRATPSALSATAPPGIFNLGEGDGQTRREDILVVAWGLFARRGFVATSMRDIAAGTGLLAGSLYYHFRSKEALYLEVHGETLRWAAGELMRAAADQHDPWRRLEATCLRHLQIQLSPDSPTFPLMNDLPAASVRLRRALILQRDRFEQTYVELVEALPLDSAIDRGVFRVSLLTLLNSVPHWFRPGRLTLPQVTDQLLRIFGRPDRRARRRIT